MAKPSEILRKFVKHHNTDEDKPERKEATGEAAEAKDNENSSAKKGKRNALIDFIARNKK